MVDPVTDPVMCNRELVVEWRDVTHFEVGGNVSFQVVFNENNSDVIFNYKDVEFGNELHDFGGFATVGIQSSPDYAQVYSTMSPSLKNASSLLWRTTANIPNKVSGNGGGGGGGSIYYLLLFFMTLIIIGLALPKRR